MIRGVTQGADAHGVTHRSRRIAILVGATLFAFLAMVAPAAAQDGDPSKVGDLTGNLPLAVYLLIPLALVLAVLTAVALGPRGDPATSVRRSGGVARALAEGEDSASP
jgi:hypothetical protein